MTVRPIREVPKAETSPEFRKLVHEMVDRVINAAPGAETAFFVVEAGHELKHGSVPSSPAFQKGIVDDLYGIFHADVEVD